MFKGKTATQLEELQTQIESKIKNKVEGIDIGYWESLLSQLKGICDGMHTHFYDACNMHTCQWNF